jgi:hypothetical protein
MESHFPHTPPLPNLLPFLSSFTPTCFWLVVAFEILIGSHLRPQNFFLFFLLLLSLPPQMMVWHPPHTFHPGRAPSPISLLPQIPTFGWLLCCPTKRWPPKAEVTSLSQIFNVLRLAPQTKEQTAMRVHPTLRALYGPIGISSAKMWVHGRCCPGKRWQSRWRVGQWWLMLVVACFVYIVFCVVFEQIKLMSA